MTTLRARVRVEQITNLAMELFPLRGDDLAPLERADIRKK